MDTHAESENRVRGEANDPVSRLRAEESIPEPPSSDYDGGMGWRAWYDDHVRCGRTLSAGGRCYHARQPHNAYCPMHSDDGPILRPAAPSTGETRAPAPAPSTGAQPPQPPERAHPASIEHPPLTREGGGLASEVTSWEPIDVLSAEPPRVGDVWTYEEGGRRERHAVTRVNADGSVQLEGVPGTRIPSAMARLGWRRESGGLTPEQLEGLTFDHGEVRIETALERRPKPVAVVRIPGATAIVIDPSAGVPLAVNGTQRPDGTVDVRSVDLVRASVTPHTELRPTRRARPLEGAELDPVYLAGTVALEKAGCPGYYAGKGYRRVLEGGKGESAPCGCPAGRCWYDEQHARRARSEPAIERASWLRIVRG